MAKGNKIDVSAQKSKNAEIREDLMVRLDELKAKMERTNAQYETEIVAWGKAHQTDSDSREAKKELEEISKKYAEQFVDQEDELKEIDELLVKLNDSSYV